MSSSTLPPACSSIEAAAVVAVGTASAVCFALEAYGMQFTMLGLLYAWIVLRLAKRLGMLDARVLFFLASSIYTTAGSVDYYFFEDFGAFGEEPNAAALLAGSAFMVAAGAWLTAAARPSDEAVQPALDSRCVFWLAAASLGLLGAYLGLSIGRFGLSIGEIDRATLTSEQGTVAALTRNLLVACVIALTWVLGYLPRRLAATILLAGIVISLTAFDLLYFGDRRIILCMLLGIAYLTLNRSRFLPLLVPAIGVSLGLLIVFAAVRGQPPDVWIDILGSLELGSYLTPVNLDFGGFPLIATDLLASSQPLLAGAPNYLDGLLAVIPHALCPGRPPSFSAWYVQTYHSDVAAIGGGLASNWVMESYLNLGAAGIVIVGIATAGLLNRLCSPAWALAPLACAASIAAFAFIIRYDFTSFLQILGAITGAAILLGWLATRAWPEAPGGR